MAEYNGKRWLNGEVLGYSDNETPVEPILRQALWLYVCLE